MFNPACERWLTTQKAATGKTHVELRLVRFADLILEDQFNFPGSMRRMVPSGALPRIACSVAT
jgi:hypothetical protein